MGGVGAAGDLVLIGAAGAMSFATAYLLRLTVAASDRRRAATAVFLLATMAEMLLGAAWYRHSPDARGLVAAASVGGALMALSAAVFLGFLPDSPPGRDASQSSEPSRPVPIAYLVVAAGLVLLGEALMSWTFANLTGISGPIGPGGSLSAASGIASVVLSPWFVFSMAGEMALTTAFLWSRLPVPLRVMLPTQALIMALAPPALGGTDWVLLAVVGGSVAMIGLYVYQMELLYRERTLSGALGGYLLALLAAYAAMMAGVVLWQLYGDPILLAASAVAEMAVYFAAVLPIERTGRSPPFAWLERPGWTFGLLTAIFVSEFFMGAALDLVLQPSVYPAAFPFLPLSGPLGTVVAHAVSNGFWFLATVTASTWFLAMMGAEMGALVVFKIRESHDLENRIRLALMIGCYAVFAVFYPSLYFGLIDPTAPAASSVPVLGWSMGIGSYPLAAGVFGALLLTYLITGALSVLFGRRVVCSVFCTAPLMYQGTTIDAMKRFNRTGPVGRKYLSSRLSGVYRATTGVVMGSLAVTSVLSYYDTTGRISVNLFGYDPTVFLFALYFSVAWYLLFVTIPYTGNYNCVTMGWCYTGTIAQAFQKIGFFKLKVRDQAVCRACTTLDCAKGCPVGLTDMPGHFRRTGEFRSTKCCGVGDCVEDCPYGNLYIADIRHWFRRRLGRPEVGPPRSARLPMVSVRPAPSPKASAVPVAPAATTARTAMPEQSRISSPLGGV